MKNPNWTDDLAYAIGLFVADGHLSIDGRHLDFTSKDFEQVQTFKSILGLKASISKKSRSAEKEKKYYYVGFSDVGLYNFLIGIGIPQQKSKNVGKLQLPRKLIPDFLRGLIDGDGNINIAKHPESRNKQIKIKIFSASKVFLEWLYDEIKAQGIKGGRIRYAKRVWELVYGKRDALEMMKLIYYADNLPSLERKRNVAKECLATNVDFNPLRWQNRYTTKLI